MGNFLTKLDNHSEYSSFISDAVRPSVAYCEEEGHVHYDSLPVVTCVYEIDESLVGNQVALTYGQPYASLSFKKMAVDGVVQMNGDVYNLLDTFSFSGAGKHVVEWTMKDENTASLGSQMHLFDNLGGYSPHAPGAKLLYVDIPSTITSLTDTNLSAVSDGIMFNSENPPSIYSGVFNDDVTIYVPIKYLNNYVYSWHNWYSLTNPIVGVY